MVWMLTGGIGSGKSTVRRELEKIGVATIDADGLAHHMYEPDGPVFGQVAEAWPEAVVDGRIDRSILASIVFDDPVELRRLEDIVHPALTLALLDELVAAGGRDVVVEVSVPKDLLGVGPQATIIADLETGERFKRLVERGMEPSDVSRRMARQPTREEWRALGNHIVSTSGSRDEVAQRVQELWRRLSSRNGSSA